MKIRIKGNSIRLRLTKTDVQNLKLTGKVEEKTVIGENKIFSYTLEQDKTAEALHSTFENGKISVLLPTKELDILTETDEITVQGYQDNGEAGKLFLLIEKDLKCLDTTFEDQSDMYENPKTNC
ncbi:MAG: hypothetical protein K0M63_06985 [Weeksellaceae bacterium]|nr:hypothetical protein [Weeksellaceae bacterium]